MTATVPSAEVAPPQTGPSAAGRFILLPGPHDYGDHLVFAAVFSTDQVQVVDTRASVAPQTARFVGDPTAGPVVADRAGWLHTASLPAAEGLPGYGWPHHYTLLHSKALSASHSWQVWHLHSSGNDWPSRPVFAVDNPALSAGFVVRVRAAGHRFVVRAGQVTTASEVTPPPIDAPYHPPRNLFLTLATGPVNAAVTGWPTGHGGGQQTTGDGCPVLATCYRSSMWDTEDNPGPVTFDQAGEVQALSLAFMAY